MNMQTIKWYNSFKFKGMLLISLVVMGLAIGNIVLMKTKGEKLVQQESSRLVEQFGKNMVSDLNTRNQEIVALTKSLGALSENLPRSETHFKKIVPRLIDFQGDLDIAGGGVWPEPYAFNPKIEKRSFFWGRNADGELEYIDDYNSPKAGYHHEEWYAVGRHLEQGRCLWSQSYMDPYSFQPMVTCTVATYQNDKFVGTATIDLKLEGLQAFAEYWQKNTGGYVFIVDQKNRFLTFPDLSLIKKIGKDEAGEKPTEHFLLASELADKKPLFLPIANALDGMNQNILDKAKNMPGYQPDIAGQITQDSRQTGTTDAELISAIIVDPLVKTTFFKKFEIEKDFRNQEKSLVYTFYVPQSYWKVVIVKPFSEAYEVPSNIIQLVVIYLVIMVVPIILFAYVIFDWFLFQPLTTTVNTVKTMSDLVENKQQAQLKNYHIQCKNADEIGLLSASFDTLVTELDKSAKERLEEKEHLGQQIVASQQEQKQSLEKINELKTAIAECQANLRQEGIPSAEELHEQRQLLKTQQKALKRLSTPLLQVGEGILVLPQMGTLDGPQTSQILQNAQILQDVSETVAENHIQYVVINMTGLVFVDAIKTANHLTKMVQGLELMGIKCIVTGMPSKVAEALLQLKTDLTQMITFAKLQQGLHYALSN
jgi:anti-anti-sigma regulatory factor